MQPLPPLNNHELLDRLRQALALERQTHSLFLRYLAAVDERRLFVTAGFASLFVYCTDELGLTETEAFDRIHASRVARRFPKIYELLASGTLSLAAIRVLAPHLAMNNAHRLLARVAGRSLREIEGIAAELAAAARATGWPDTVHVPPFDPARAPGMRLDSAAALALDLRDDGLPPSDIRFHAASPHVTRHQSHTPRRPQRFNGTKHLKLLPAWETTCP